ncbi:glucan 1,3-beta-glucosidase [Colletotrichum tofieldiae]|uniref:Glucan 1,3-beta-glucosidase n=1 Tax=Colletotrichum tofieldiae TaxID=708197 RepID=A0A166WU32_9PEZI|nr:glucan 1,3-beta-glucosidase [Colletotrichum tofieldiae]GKT54285.1 glucan 1,3-beta-glucosidase [Colletotrichum tofieldiae]GKT74007.1 glucan 1,3-beta-glucosidase [Colletotrichum tofieldiae]GKT95995.1 glucan 1,3-beta-glucosidase [Colletotrichum tofieldiae]
MKASLSLAALSALAATAEAQNWLGFNSGATKADRSAKFKADFAAEFKTAQNLEGAPGDFNAVRLYTNIQAYSTDDPIEAFEAAIETKTYILLGVWTSGTDNIDKEINALKKAVTKYGTKLTDLIIGASIGSEDLYRNSVTGVKNKSGVGADPKTLVGFIDDFKSAFKDTPLSKVSIGHVDTWDVWGNTTNKPVLDAIDWVGVDEYPYYENDKGNDIKNAGKLFDKAYEATIATAGGKPVWVTETGWPVTGETWDEAVPSKANAKKYWDEIGCRQLFNKVPTFWYNLRDSNPDNTMKFAITQDLSTTPLFNLTCPTTFDTPTGTSSSSATGTATAKPSSSSGSSSGGSGSGSGSSSGSGSGANATVSTGAPAATGSGSGSSGSGSGAEASSTPSTVPASGASGIQVFTTGALAAVAGAFALLY